jgi:hypothetical protein
MCSANVARDDIIIAKPDMKIIFLNSTLFRKKSPSTTPEITKQTAVVIFI